MNTTREKSSRSLASPSPGKEKKAVLGQDRRLATSLSNSHNPNLRLYVSRTAGCVAEELLANCPCLKSAFLLDGPKLRGSRTSTCHFIPASNSKGCDRTVSPCILWCPLRILCLLCFATTNHDEPDAACCVSGTKIPRRSMISPLHLSPSTAKGSEGLENPNCIVI